MGKLTLIAAPARQEIIITYLSDVARQRLFKAFTDPALIPLWWGQEIYTTTIDKMNATPGGTWRFIQKDKRGNEFAFHGMNHEVSSPRRLVETFEFEGTPGHVSLETATCEDKGGKTLLTQRAIFESVEDRDAMVQSCMESGVNPNKPALYNKQTSEISTIKSMALRKSFFPAGPSQKGGKVPSRQSATSILKSVIVWMTSTACSVI